jgi:hypothetical protein
MRFIANGPSIPDSLLNARDDGNVVFFCGAGVSRARAGLPDFFGLAEAVLRELGAAADCDARKLLKEAADIGNRLNIPGLISADVVFSLLERDFAVKDIHSAVAKSLAPTTPVDVSAHRALLRLATTRSSKVQIVTTNFDRLFEQCGLQLAFHQPPRLPNPSRYDDLNGIVYLHGRVSDGYVGADGNGFVLSSSEFGYAYLSEGWAAEFFRDVVRRYVVIFVGCSADDPPIRYLLEGLRRADDPSRHIYAFQSGDVQEAVARWHHKGVEAIPYVPEDGHRALWETLHYWADRADDPHSWRERVLASAIDGPEKLQPHQRGQVAHIVSTSEGAREFVGRTPPAEWLCVFDPSCRYAKPGRLERLDTESPVVDPFWMYGLDVDSCRNEAKQTVIRQRARFLRAHGTHSLQTTLTARTFRTTICRPYEGTTRETCLACRSESAILPLGFQMLRISRRLFGGPRGRSSFIQASVEQLSGHLNGATGNSTRSCEQHGDTSWRHARM